MDAGYPIENAQKAKQAETSEKSGKQVANLLMHFSFLELSCTVGSHLLA
jgi:hypothetical protein